MTSACPTATVVSPLGSSPWANERITIFSSQGYAISVSSGDTSACQDPLHGGSERLTASRSGKAIEKNCRRGEALDLSYIKCTPRTRLILGKNEYISPVMPVLARSPCGMWVEADWFW